MRLLRAAWPLGGGSCLVLALASACGSTTGSNVNGNTGGNVGKGTAGKTGTGGPTLGDLGGESAISSSGGGRANPPCAGDLIQAERIPLDMYVMLDQSGSMLEATVGDANVTKWAAVSSALTDFISDQASDGIGMGLQLFPIQSSLVPASCKTAADCANFGTCLRNACKNYPDLIPCDSAKDCRIDGINYGPCEALGSCSANKNFVCPVTNLGLPCGIDAATNQDLGACETMVSSTCTVTDDCRTATYATPAAAIAPLPGAKAALVGVLQKAMPNGFTPTQPALTGAIDQATAWAKLHTDHQVVAVLATDGIPTLKANGNYCASITAMSATADINAVVNVASGGQTAMPKISTFVIGVVGPADTGAPDVLNAIANAGGTDKAFIVDTTGDVQTEFRAALNAIRSAGLSCDLLVPQAEAGKKLDYGSLNVELDVGKNVTPLVAVADASGCDAAHPDAWYYDVAPTAGTPTRIITCPTTCTKFQNTDMGSVKIELGCETRKVK